MKPEPQTHATWVNFLPSGIVTIAAIAVIVLAPFLALNWYRLPFLGVLLEPNMVVVNIDAVDWPAMDAGVQHPDRLISAGGTAVQNAAALQEMLTENQFEPITLSFKHQDDGPPYTVTVTPRNLTSGEFLRLFFIPYLVSLAFLLIGLWAFRLDTTNYAVRVFLIFTAAASLGTSTFFDLRTSHNLALLWVLSLPIAAGALAHLALVFPRRVGFVKRYSFLRFIPWSVAVAVAIPSSRQYLNPSTPWAYIHTWLNSYAFAAIVIVAFMGILLWRALFENLPVVRQQSRIIVFGAALAFGPIFILFFLPVALGFVQPFRAEVLIPPLLIFPLSVAYAIVRYRLLDIDRLLSSSLNYGLTTTGAIVLFYFVIMALSFALGENLNSDDPLVMAIFLLVLMLLLNPIRNLAQGAIDHIFYRTRADYGYVLSHLSRSLVITPNLNRVLKLLEELVEEAFKPLSFVLYLYNDDQRIYIPHSNLPHSKKTLAPENGLIRYLTKTSEAVWLPPGVSYPEEITPEVELIGKLGYQIFVPLNYQARLIGFLAIGPRRSGEPYTGDDLDFLNAVAGQSSLAVENTRLFSNLEQTLDETLEMKNLMDDIFTSMPSGVITTDLAVKITLFNEAAQNILGANVTAVLGRSMPEALPTYWPGLKDITSSTIERGVTTLGHEYSPTKPDGSQLHLRLSATPLRDAHLDTKGATLLIDDLTKQREIKADRERIRQTFGRVVAPRVRDRLLNDPSSLQLDGVSQTITVMFADLHNFTAFSERTPPDELFEVLNSYLSLAAQSVLEEEGTLDKFMGDAVMAMWNAPDRQKDHALRAVRAALAMQKAIRTHRAEQAEEHQLYFSVGISSGEAVVGNVGTSELFNYTAIGDTVNLAQRLEASAEIGQILLSETVFEAVKGHVAVNKLKPIKVKGRKQAVNVYDLISLK
ncbi:MAG: PAS domain S-box protein [Chloroflexi bacterium]|nr:PAS domain S-box protein [Chloroflexota bacterium]